ncbi:hypothetical protein [Halomonas maura]|uniref:hypothetical protein n=1 Tax=Halomonas maura TaxID=117606 RepID=UPI0025B46940|nr:hypothetical protein [Halomonas maura]MDN3555527.1 hypothetical protein [Halomonas maura]
MTTLLDRIVELRNNANVYADELHEAWKKLNESKSPTLQDLEQWLEVGKRFCSAQDAFEEKLPSFL